jgi:quercetin dioxygenase-like cupin family protein
MTLRVTVALILLLGIAAAERSAGAAEEERPMAVADPSSLKFTPIPDMPSCVSGAILRGNPRSGPAWVLLKLASGCRVPWHWHTANEDLVIISGRGTIEAKDGPALRMVPGAYASLPSHHVHHASCSRACLFFSIADAAFDIHYVDANGKEISAGKAFPQAAKPKGNNKKK